MNRSLDDHRIDAAALWAGLSHDLRQPIQSLLLLMHVAGHTEDPVMLRRTLGHMEQGLLSMQEMVEAIGLLSRLEAGIATPKRQMSALSDLVADADSAKGRWLDGWDVRCGLRGGDTPIEGDRALLVMVLRALIMVARMASADGVVQISGRRDEGQVMITCAYRGEPVSTAQRKTYFNEMPPPAGEVPGGTIVFGVAFIERLAAAIGWNAAITTGAKRTQRLVLSQCLRAKQDRMNEL